MKGAESETSLEDLVLEPGPLKRLALGIFRMGPASKQGVRDSQAEALP